MLNIKLCGFFRIILYCRDVQRLSYQRFMTKNKFPHLFSAKIKSSVCGVLFYLRFPINEWTRFVIGCPADNRRKSSMAIYMPARKCFWTDRGRTQNITPFSQQHEILVAFKAGFRSYAKLNRVKKDKPRMILKSRNECFYYYVIELEMLC